MQPLKNFDEVEAQRMSMVSLEDRRFTICGESLTRRAAMPLLWFKKAQELQENGDFDGMVDAVAMVLEPGSDDTYRRLVAEGRVSIAMNVDLSEWLVEQAAARPTAASRPSLNGSVTPITGTPSTGGYSSIPVPASPSATSEVPVT